ncbi:hypothetical protein BDP27DRAFT_1426111 [Rhodocollybia butyracea]|uniref:Uncharacterized protein n=1 Tax=Rhodocollybia butyracea TaxID=206335 RepID=A0A9P5PIT8_9AGAR|nr:hypothetical protein BDP27DRAFT_1426111 [Rhodocollybia butyracea]
MSVVNEREVGTVKRAALFSTALTWLFANFPTVVFPAPLQPPVLLLKKIVPYLSYIVTFISCGSGVFTGYDSGYGIELNATWLLSAQNTATLVVHAVTTALVDLHIKIRLSATPDSESSGAELVDLSKKNQEAVSLERTSDVPDH